MTNSLEYPGDETFFSTSAAAQPSISSHVLDIPMSHLSAAVSGREAATLSGSGETRRGLEAGCNLYQVMPEEGERETYGEHHRARSLEGGSRLQGAC